MPRTRYVGDGVSYGLSAGDDCGVDGDDIERLLALCDADDALGRQVAARNLCTCHVRSDDDRIWPQLLRLFEDDDARVRKTALHALTDSTPAARIPSVVAALERRYNDPDRTVRKRVRQTLNHYRRTGKITDAPR